ncbi:hypothetical protein V5E97_22935 [Singulisphaera sp. Ch08]|uniref:Secreted protein n=1 Tax=Singulisphaera sp. Ch08 TaxID=3120278 RepID=A0AAU7C7E8_9BACT
MHSIGCRLAALAILMGLTGCGGGIQEGIPPGAGQALTPEQQKEHDALVAQEEAESKARNKGKSGP